MSIHSDINIGAHRLYNAPPPQQSRITSPPTSQEGIVSEGQIEPEKAAHAVAAHAHVSHNKTKAFSFPALPELETLKRGFQELVDKAISSLVNFLGLTPDAKAMKTLKNLEKLEFPKLEGGSSQISESKGKTYKGQEIAEKMIAFQEKYGHVLANHSEVKDKFDQVCQKHGRSLNFALSFPL